MNSCLTIADLKSIIDIVVLLCTVAFKAGYEFGKISESHK